MRARSSFVPLRAGYGNDVTRLQRFGSNTETIGDAGRHCRHNPTRQGPVVVFDVHKNLNMGILPVELRHRYVHLNIDVVVETQSIIMMRKYRRAGEQRYKKRKYFHSS